MVKDTGVAGGRAVTKVIKSLQFIRDIKQGNEVTAISRDSSSD